MLKLRQNPPLSANYRLCSSCAMPHLAFRSTLRLLFVLAMLFTAPAHAALHYVLESAHASPLQTLPVKGVLVNDSPSAMHWKPPTELPLVWTAPDGQEFRTTATLVNVPDRVDLPVNNFATLHWETTVPAQAAGQYTLAIGDSASRWAIQIGNPPGTSPAAGSGNVRPASPKTPPVPTTESHRRENPASTLATFQSAISPYEPIYFDMGNKGGRNARFQVSFKYRLFTPTDPANPGVMDSLYLGYTQTSLWDLESDSLPFVDTSFKPSIFWRRDSLWGTADGQAFLGLATGVEHESNGKSGDDSRSINFAYVQPEFNYRMSGGSTLTFAPRIKSYFGMGNNRDYTDYAGYVDWKLRWAQDNGLVLSGLYRHGSNGRSTTQIEAAWPLRRTFLDMNGYLHVQYFQGYGQTLLGYDRKSDPQVRLGIALVP